MTVNGSSPSTFFCVSNYKLFVNIVKPSTLKFSLLLYDYQDDSVTCMSTVISSLVRINCQKKYIVVSPFFFHRQWQRTAVPHRKTPKGQDGCARDRRRGVWKLAKWSSRIVRSGPWGVRGVHFRGPSRRGDRRGERRCASRDFIRISGDYPRRHVPARPPGQCFLMCCVCQLLFMEEIIDVRRNSFSSAKVQTP